MTRREFVHQVAERSGLSLKESRKVVDTIFSTDDRGGGILARLLADGQKLTLPGFGTFEARRRRGRTVRNPQTGQLVTVPPGRYPSFRPGKNLKELVRG